MSSSGKQGEALLDIMKLVEVLQNNSSDARFNTEAQVEFLALADRLDKDLNDFGA